MAKVTGDRRDGARGRGSASCADKDLEDTDEASLLQRPARTKDTTETTFIFTDTIPSPIFTSRDRSGQHGNVNGSDRDGWRSGGP